MDRFIIGFSRKLFSDKRISGNLSTLKCLIVTDLENFQHVKESYGSDVCRTFVLLTKQKLAKLVWTGNGRLQKDLLF